MKKETYTRTEIVDAIERLKKREREYCDNFCVLNGKEAAEERRRVASVVLGTLNSVLYALDCLNG